MSTSTREKEGWDDQEGRGWGCSSSSGSNLISQQKEREEKKKQHDAIMPCDPSVQSSKRLNKTRTKDEEEGLSSQLKNENGEASSRVKHDILKSR
jgi:hypothetical protein